MSFSAEVKDFVSGFQVGANVGGDIQDRKLARDKFEVQQAIDERDYAFDREKFEATKVRSDRAFGLREKAYNDSKEDRAARRAEREAAAEEKKRAKRAYDVLPEEDKKSAKSSAGKYEDEWDEAYPTEDLEDSSEIPVMEVDDEEVAEFKQGGMVAHAEEGGLLESNEEEKQDIETAIPVAPPAGEPEVQREEKTDMLLEQAKEPIRDVMKTLAEEGRESKQAAVPTKKIQDRVAAIKPATPDEIKAIDAKVDPNNELAPYRKGAARLVSAYNFFVEKGEPDKARKIAAQIIKFDQMASMTLGTLAQSAAEQNDVVSASKLLTDAYNEHLPDGNTLTAQPTEKGTVLYKIERDGKVMQEGEADTRQIWEMAGKVADGSEFLKRMARLANEGGTSEGNPKGAPVKKGKRSYPEDLRAAARAANEIEALQKDIETLQAEGTEEGSEELTQLQKQFNAKLKEAEKAMARAEQSRAKTGRPMDVFEKDFINARKASKQTALPQAFPEAAEATEAPLEALPANRNAWQMVMPTWLGGAEEEPAAEQAVPESAPVTPTGKPIPPETLAKAKAAIAEGRSRAGVIKKLQDAGYDTRGL
jgi:hypothetical protein